MNNYNKIILFFVLIIILKLVRNHEISTSVDIPVSIQNPINEFDKVITYSTRACKLHIKNDTINPQPLLIHPGTELFYNPSLNGYIEIPFGHSIELSCNNNFTGKLTNINRIYATCVGDKKFLINGKRYNFNELICQQWSKSITRQTNYKCNHGLANIIEIGFQITKYRFLKIAEICHNEYISATHYVLHYLNPNSIYYQHNISRVSFRKDNFYKTIDVDKMYKQTVQKSTIGDILKNNDHEKYFNNRSLFFARGHLSAKADHIYGSQQRATFYYINAAPQWQTFNAGNWQTIENNVKIFVAKQQIYVECYTGTWGIGTLADRYGKHHDLYLYFDENNNGHIPVPKLYYRVVIEPLTKRGIVLIGVNNPHLTIDEIEEDYIICNDISDLITWINWDKKNIRLGYTYACEVNEFVKVVDHLPYLDVTDILY